MTFSYDMSIEPKYEKPTYPGTGNGMSGDSGEYDIIVIGSGMGGLACSALSAKYGSRVLCLESHIKVGGSAHTFSRMHNGGKYSFEVGPSIFEGLDRPSLNPLRMIFDILEETMPVKTYKGLGYWTPSGYWRFPIGSREGFEQLLMEQCGEDGEKAIGEWKALRERLRTLGGSTQAVALLNLRQDAGFLATTAGSLPFVVTHPDVFGDLSLTFDDLSKTVDEFVTVPFLRNFIDTMCIFCGFPAKGAMTAHLLYILERFFEETAAFSVPIGGTCELGNTLQRGLEKYGGKLQLNAHVDEILVENGRAVGVRLKNGNVVKARKAVVSNATPFDTVKLMPKAEGEPKGLTKWREELGKLPRHGAISHLFLAIDAEGLDLSHIQDPAHLVVQVRRMTKIATCWLKSFRELTYHLLQVGLGSFSSRLPKSLLLLHPIHPRQNAMPRRQARHSCLLFWWRTLRTMGKAHTWLRRIRSIQERTCRGSLACCGALHSRCS
jgi:phytoene dehydrogenase-like protein